MQKTIELIPWNDIFAPSAFFWGQIFKYESGFLQ